MKGDIGMAKNMKSKKQVVISQLTHTKLHDTIPISLSDIILQMNQ